MGTRPGSVIMLLAGGVNGLFIGMVIIILADGIIGNRDDTLTEVCMTLEVVAPVSYAIDGRVVIMFNIDVSSLMRVEVMVDILIAALVRTVINVVPEINIWADVDANMWVTVMPVLDFTILPTSLERLLMFSCTAFS